MRASDFSNLRTEDWRRGNDGDWNVRGVVRRRHGHAHAHDYDAHRDPRHAINDYFTHYNRAGVFERARSHG